MNPTTLEKPMHPKPPKAATSLSFTLETTGDWEVIGTPKPGAGTGSIKIEFTEEPGGTLGIQVEGHHPGRPNGPSRATAISSFLPGTHGGKTPREHWIGPITCMIHPTREVTFIGK